MFRFLLVGVMLVGSSGLQAQGVPAAGQGPLGLTPGVVVDRLLATVNGEVVTLSDVRAARGLRPWTRSLSARGSRASLQPAR